MRNPIKKEVIKNLVNDKFYYTCCLEDEECKGHIQFHHNFRFQGKNIGVEFAILPCCVEHHRREKETGIKEKLDFIMLGRMTPENRADYLSSEWLQREKYLKSKFEKTT